MANSSHWQPTASIADLKKRSQILQSLRAFFYARNVYEVDTPILSQAATPDLHLHSLQTQVAIPGEKHPVTYYAHTSPEYAMKRLLSAGSGDIFYLGKVFRNGDLSPRHQVEFTMLEWYRTGFSLQQMMQETAQLIQQALGDIPIKKLSYQQAFADYAGIADIHQASAQECRQCLQQHQVAEVIGVDPEDKTLWEQLVLTEVIEPKLGRSPQGDMQICCLYHYPARDAALAKICKDNPHVAERFEIFVDAMELANGYFELSDAPTYRQRFAESLQQRQAAELPSLPLDEMLLQALAEGQFPECSGVALGVDRLMMLALKQPQIAGVLPFSTLNA